MLARLECEDPRLWPGAAQEAFSYWLDYLRDPYAWRWERPDSCHIWECCPDIDEARDILRTVLHNLPRPDARRLRARLAALGDDLD